MWVNVIVVQNGLGLYQTWAAIASVLNLGFALNNYEGLSVDDTCWVGVSVIGVLFLVNFIFDLAMGEKYRYQFTPYLVYIWAFAGIIARDVDPDADYMKLVLAELVMFGAGLLIKLVVTIAMAVRHPSALERSN